MSQKKNTKKTGLNTAAKAGLAGLMTASLVTNPMTASKARAQEDFPPPPDFGDSSFPAPISPAGSGGSSGSSSSSSGGSSGASNSVLSKAQQEKFNRSGVEDVTNENFPETIESFDFPNVEITDLIKTIGELTGKNFIIDPGVRGKITIIAPSKLTVAEAYKAFLSALAINGYTVVPMGSFLKVKNARNAQRDSIETYSGAYYPNDDQMITRIIHLKHINAEIVNRELRILPSKDGEMSIYSPTNSIILSDYGSNIDRVMKIINQLDVPGFEEQIEVVPVKYAKAKDMADLIDKIVNKGQKSSAQGPAGSFSSGVPRFSRTGGGGGAQGQSGNSFFMAIPDDRTNSIIVVGNKSGITRVKRLLAQLDFRIRPEDTGGVFVYYVKNGDAEKIAQVLQGVTKDAAPKPGAGGGGAPGGFPNFGFGGAGGQSSSGTEIFGGDVKITADKNTNSLVVVASKPDYEQVLNLLSKIDIARDQVYVEAVIMEMSMTDMADWKVGYYKFGENGYGKTGFNGLGSTALTDLLSPTGTVGGGLLGFADNKKITVTSPTGTTSTIPSLVGFINFLKTNIGANILSTPQITALDNEEATIEVGDKVATSISNSQTSTGVTTQTPTFEDATIKLKIKPFIAKTSNSIRMEIDQSVKQPGTAIGPKAIQDSTLPLQTRSIKTQIVVHNGGTAILGGLMKDNDNESISKVPLLGDLPIIGWLFKSRSTNKQKVNLVVFLTPKIIRSQADSNQIIGKKLDERLEFVKATGGRDPYGAKAAEIQARMAGTPLEAPSSPIFDNPSPAPAKPQPAPTPSTQDPLGNSLKAPPTGPTLSEPPPPAPSKAQGSPAPSDELQMPSNELDFPADSGEGVDPALVE